MSGPYDDIISLPHPTSSRHPRMPISDRAAQFSPFAALAGHSAALAETARLTDRQIELSDDDKAVLDQKQRILLEHTEKNCPPFWRPLRSRVFIPPMSCGNFSGICLLRMRSLETSTGITATGASSWMRRSSRQNWHRSMIVVPAYTRSLIWNG